MRRRVLITILLYLAMSAAPACAIKNKMKASFKPTQQTGSHKADSDDLGLFKLFLRSPALSPEKINYKI